MKGKLQGGQRLAMERKAIPARMAFLLLQLFPDFSPVL